MSRKRRKLEIASATNEMPRDIPGSFRNLEERVKYCLEWGFLGTKCCRGCQKFADAKGFVIDMRDETSLNQMDAALAKRHETHSSHTYKCLRPWTLEVSGANVVHAEMIHYQEAFINRKFQGRAHLVKSSSSSSDCSDASSKKRSLPQESSPSTTARPDGDAAIITPSEKPKRNVTLLNWAISSQGTKFRFKIPKSHIIMLKAEATELRRIKKRVRKMKKSFNQKQFIKKASPEMKAYLSTALASVPALGISAAAYLFPLVIGAWLAEFKLLDGVKPEKYAKAFPSETYLRMLMLDHAAQESLSLSKRLSGKQVTLACDKGHTKGCGVFVKMLTWFENGQVQVRLLDINASEGSHEDCGLAVHNSLKKVRGGITFKLRGITTDSGGGGILEGLANDIISRGVCQVLCLVANCTIHGFQLQLSRPTKELLGEGGLGKKNVMQLLHSIYDLQQSMEWSQMQYAMDTAQDWVNKYYDKDYIGDPSKQGDVDFAEKWNKVRHFRKFEQYFPPTDKKAKWQKCPACVLTRWGYVGQASNYGWKHYLMLLKLCQIIINTYGSDARPNVIASGLQPLLLEEEIFSHLALTKDFHTLYFDNHLGWLMGSNDLTNKESFQSHQIAVRYYIMARELEEMKSTITTDHDGFVDFRASLSNLTDIQKQEHLDKSTMFVTTAMESLDKHFTRWVAPKLLPAALMSEVSFAKAVARVINGVSTTPMNDDEPVYFESDVHKRELDPLDFELFLREKLAEVMTTETDSPFQDKDLECANALLQGSDFRDLKQHNPSVLHRCLWYFFLPLASNTQFLEAGVKEANLVSVTNRAEEQRSAYAIIRSSRILSVGKLRDMKTTDRIAATIESANAFVAHQKELQKAPVYASQLKSVRKELWEDHFKKERKEKLNDKIADKAEKNKKSNARQKNTGIDKTLAAEGLVPYKKGVIKGTKTRGHQQEARLGLEHRGCPEELILGFMDNKWGEMKSWLNANEIERVKGMAHASELARSNALLLAEKGFMIQSAAKFKPLD